jgi:hypothetical protein
MKYLFYCLFTPPPVYILHPPLRFSALSPPARFGFGVELFLVHDLIEVAYLKHLSIFQLSQTRFIPSRFTPLSRGIQRIIKLKKQIRIITTRSLSQIQNKQYDLL